MKKFAKLIMTIVAVLIVICLVTAVYHIHEEGNEAARQKQIEEQEKKEAHEKMLEEQKEAASLFAIELYYDLANLNQKIYSKEQLHPYYNSQWQEQARNSAIALWEPDKKIDYTSVLQAANVYDDMIKINEEIYSLSDIEFSQIQSKLNEWKNKWSENNMNVTFNIGFSPIVMSDKNSMDISLRTMANIDDPDYNKAYLYPGEFWVFGGSATITNEKGNSIVLQEGMTDLSNVSGFKEGLYTLQENHQYAGSILPAPTSGAADLTSCAILEYGNSKSLAYYDPHQISTGGGLVVDGDIKGKLTVDFSSGSSSESVDVFPIIQKHNSLISQIEKTIISSSNAAGAAWYECDTNTG